MTFPTRLSSSPARRVASARRRRNFLPASGARVVVNYREDRAGAEQVSADDHRGRRPGHAASKAMPAVEADVRRMMETVGAQWGPIRVLVHNASAINRAYFLDVTLDHFDLMFDANVRGPFLMSQLATRQMIDGGRRAAASSTSARSWRG